MKNILKYIIVAAMLFGTVPVSAMEYNKENTEEIKKKKKKKGLKKEKGKKKKGKFFSKLFSGSK